MSPNTTATPRKAPRRATKGESKRHDDDGDDGDDDDDEEPTPRPHPLTAVVPVMSPTSIHHAPSSPSRSSASSHASSIASTESRKRKRGTSPSKQRLELNQYAEQALKLRAWGRLDELPEEMRGLASSMQSISKGRRVLSSQHKAWESQVGSGIAEEDGLIFADTGVREETGKEPELDLVRRVLRRAERNAQCNCSEPAWNSGVHDFLLDMAHVGSRFTDGVMWENITTARIHPSSLLEATSTQGSNSHERADSKRVDFCIALQMEPSLGKRLAAKGVQLLNHTDYGGTRYNPISISIETKAGMEAGADATLQLTTWAAAQNTFLRRTLQKLGRPDMTIPSLPLIMIQGHQWNFYYAQMKTDSMILWTGGDAFGNTSTLLGIYRIIAGLQKLMQWAETVYKPWFIKNITDPLLANVAQVD